MLIGRRYDAIVCSSNREENVASGQLELLMLHSPEIKNLSIEGSNTHFKILPPENVNDTAWFTTTTLKRFLHIIDLPDILSVGKEICQLVETKNFQLSLSNQAEDEITSVESKNELLIAVDLRLTALKEELAAALNQAIGCRCSPKDFSDLRNFSLHIGANDLKDSIHLLTEEDSISSSEEDEQFVEQSRGLSISLTPRRSSSPMRRVQIGRSGSRRLSIKSLNNLSAIEKSKSMSQRDVANNSSEDEDSHRLTKNSGLKMSVQDKISLFESKQRDQGAVDIQKTKMTVGVKKSVLKRWSTSIGSSNDVSSPSSPNNVAPIAITEPVKTKNKTETCDETSENMSFLPEKGGLVHLRVEVNSLEHESECSQQKGDELKEFCDKLMESKPIRHQEMNCDNSKSKKLKEQKGGFYDLYKKKKEDKLKTEASGRVIEKEAKMVFTKVSSSDNRRHSENEPQKTQLINPKTTKPSPMKKTTPKSSPSRKSWPSTPSPKAARASPAFSPTGPTYRKPHVAAKVEESQPHKTTPKSTQSDSIKRNKVINEKKQSLVTENKKITKTNIQSPTKDTTATTKHRFYKNVTRKNSVVPVETKPFLRKGSGMGTSVGPFVTKTKGVVCKTEDNKLTSHNQVNHSQPTENHAIIDLEHEMVSLNSLTKCEASGSKTEMSEINSTTEEDLEISCSAWVVDEEPNQDEIVSCNESPIKLSSPTEVTPRPRVRHSLSQILFDESNESEFGAWGNAEHPPTMIYHKEEPRGLKRLLKFARKAKADSYLTDCSSPSPFSEREDNAEESRGIANFSKINIQSHQRVTEAHVSASINTTKATRSFFSLSAFRGNKTNQAKLVHR
ncbi:uncharacterized protein [Rutidosis leptorrhynchoides]|uniref:uncharacterized protein n=1 Tax=Rutidosis leptorrhynchoides TaxID=125765 RepID=UPI003A9976D9